MTAMTWAVVVLAGLLAMSLVSVIWALEAADDRDPYRPSRKQLKAWRKERLKFARKGW